MSAPQAPAYEQKNEYAPQPQGYPPQQPYPQQQAYPQQPVNTQPPAQVIIQQVQAVTPLASLQQEARVVDCPACHVQQMTVTEYVSGTTTTVSAVLCCLVTCLGCIPYLLTWAKDCEHKCGSCGTLLAVWHRSGRTVVIANHKNASGSLSQ